MVNKCSAYGCKSGYDSQVTSVGISFHSFPKDTELRDKWIRANPRKDFVPSKHSRLCSLHFVDSDFVLKHKDSNSARLKTYSSEDLLLRYLKKMPTLPFFSMLLAIARLHQLCHEHPHQRPQLQDVSNMKLDGSRIYRKCLTIRITSLH